MKYFYTLLFTISLALSAAAQEVDSQSEAYQALIADFNKADQDYGEMMMSDDPDFSAPFPIDLFMPKFQTMAATNDPDAMAWVLQRIDFTDLVDDEKVEARLQLVNGLASFPNRWAMVQAVTEESLRASHEDPEWKLSSAESVFNAMLKTATDSQCVSHLLLTQYRLNLLAGSPGKDLLVILDRMEADFPKSAAATMVPKLRFAAEKLQPGQPLPDFQGEDVMGNVITQQSLGGKPTLLLFWNLHEDQSRDLVIETRTLHEAFRSKGLFVLGVANDGKKKSFMRSVQYNGHTWDNLYSGDNTNGLAIEWGLLDLPTTLLVDAQGIIRARGLNGDALTKAVEALVSP